MAISRGAGTEIIRTIHADRIDSTATRLIIGVQHHIYTVLSIIFNAYTWQAAGNWVQVSVWTYDSRGGDTGREHQIFRQDMNVKETYVWNDKFSFNGFEPVDFSGPLTTAAQQDAIADQGSAVYSYLVINTEHADDAGHVSLTYIDQNNA